MRTVFYKNSANIIVLIRVLLVFVLIALLENPSAVMRIAGLFLLVFIALLDWLDGYIAEKFCISSQLGGMLDTLGDRITENVLFIFFAYKHVLPVYVPLFFIVRSLSADFIRFLNFQKGFTTFSVHTSLWGKWLVSSRLSRAMYLCMKIAVFILCTFVLIAQSVDRTVMLLETSILWLAFLTVIVSFMRFVCLVYDSRTTLKDIFWK